MAALKLTRNALHKSEMEHHGKFGHTLGWIHIIDFMSRIDIYYTACCLENQNVARTIIGLQGIKYCIQYLGINPHKTIIYPSNYYYG